MSGEFATPVAVRKHRAPPVPLNARLRAASRSARALSRTSWDRLNATVAHLVERLPSRQETLAALAELRLPGTPDPAVRMRRLLGVSAWAGLLGIVGLVIGARVVFGIFTEMPLWYWFLIFVLGIPGVVATFTAFATLHKGQLPWKLLRAASAAEALALLATLLS